jgi:hypothetical protein
MKVLLIFCFMYLFAGSEKPELSKEGSKKLNKLLSELYHNQKLQIDRLNLAGENLTDNDILNADGKWFAISEAEKLVGWLMTDKAWGRYHEFEYAIVIDTNLFIKDVSVLSYPASHGNAVTNKSWLYGFNGFSPDNIPVYGREIDALSGASISGPHLSESIAKALLILKKLDEQALLKSPE